MDKDITKGVGELVEYFYLEYGKAVNSSRAIPYIYDGLKPSHRRTIYSQLLNKGEKQKTINLIGNTLKFHPHGDQSITDVVTELVHRNIFDGYGSFGYNAMYGESMKAAAPRYTDVRLKPGWYNLISELMSIVPYKVSETDDSLWEPEYLPFPIPIALCTGLFGVGVGTSTQIPAFSPKSILAAYKADNPDLLEPAFDIELDKENSDIHKYWNNGRGIINWKYRYYPETSEDGSQGVVVEGSTQVFVPDWSEIEEWKEDGQLFIRDESKGKNGRVFVGKNYNVRKINQEYILEMVERAVKSVNTRVPNKQAYNVGVYNGEYSQYLSMKDWIDFTYKNYLKLFEEWRSRKLSALKAEKLVYEFLPKVAELIMDNPKITDEEIYEAIPNITEDTLKSILRKSINTLRKVDSDAQLDRIKSSIKYFKSIDAEKYIEESLNNL